MIKNLKREQKINFFGGIGIILMVSYWLMLIVRIPDMINHNLFIGFPKVLAALLIFSFCMLLTTLALAMYYIILDQVI